MIMSVLATLVVVYVFYLLLLYFVQNKLIFIGAKPNHLLYKKLEHCSDDISSDNYILQGWRVNGSKPDSGVIAIYFGGNAEDTSGMLSILSQLNVKQAYAYNYRGYGLSEGVASERGICFDALTIYNHVIKKSPNTRFIIIGQSLGSAVAGYLASKKIIDKLILLSPLSSISDIAKLRFKNTFPNALVKHKFELIEHVRNVTAKTLVIIAQKDSVIPYEHAMKTYKNITSEKQLSEIEGADHNDLFVFSNTTKKINQFISV